MELLDKTLERLHNNPKGKQITIFDVIKEEEEEEEND